MALKQQITNSNYPSVVRSALGITDDVNELYIKITSLHQQEQQCEIRVDFFNYKSINDLQKLNIPAVYEVFEVDESEESTNNRQQGYEYLKTLEHFADCEDC